MEDGLTIAYYLPTTSADNVTLNLTINDTPTGAIDVYYNGSTRMGTQYPAGSTIILTYFSANSISINGTAVTTARWVSDGATITSPVSPYTSTPEEVSTTAGAVGTSGDFARGDHVHKLTVATSVTAGDTKPVTSDAVATAISNLPEPMVFKGTVGTSGTVEWANLPSPASSGSGKNIGWTYKVITDHDTAPVCEAGDVIVSDGTNWVVIPAGDEPSGVTNVAAGVGLTTASGSAITSTGTVKAHLKSETALTGAATNATETSGRVYATVVDSNGDLATVVPWTDTTYTANNSNITTVSAFSANTPTAVTLPTYTVTDNVLTITAGTVSAGSAASLTTGTESVTTSISAN